MVALLLPRGRKRMSIKIRTTKGRRLRRFSAPRGTDRYDLALSGRWLVFSTPTEIRILDIRTGLAQTLAKVEHPIGLSVEGRRLAWAEPNRIRAVELPRG
jgi:hypothetical protein